MLRTRNMTEQLSVAKKEVYGGGGETRAAEWELRPGGMLVQKRGSDADHTLGRPPPTIRVRVKYGSTYHEIAISSQATFGELKKKLSGPTGLHHQDQKLVYKDKEKDSSAFLDVCGVKDRSKLLLVEDPISHEKRLLEIRKNAKIEKASKSISQISLEVDRLVAQVVVLEGIVANGKKVGEKDVVVLIELLMNELLKLDSIIAEGDAKLQRKLQVKRVQKNVETLDMIKLKHSRPYNKLGPIQEQPRDSMEEQNFRSPPPLLNLHSAETDQPSTNSETVVTTMWETFESAPPSKPSPGSNQQQQPQFPWDLYD